MCSFLFLSAAAFSGDDEWVPVNPFSGDEEMISKGRTLFNVYCSHCHGPNAIQGERPRDLRRLSRLVDISDLAGLDGSNAGAAVAGAAARIDDDAVVLGEVQQRFRLRALPRFLPTAFPDD